MKFTIPAIYRKPVFRVDRSVKLEFETREVKGSDLAVLADLRDTEGWLLFSANQLEESDIPKEKAVAEYGSKTPGQRLRGALFRLWEQKGQPDDFEIWYRAKMERIIDQIKEQLV